MTNLSISDFTLKEEGITRTITNISCPTPKPPDTLSSVLVIDVSGSMNWGPGNTTNMDLAKKAARAWVTALPQGSECAITSFDTYNYLNQDFTQNKSLLNSAIDKLSPMGGTYYNTALIEPMAGGLLVSKQGKHKRVIVFLTDGMPLDTPSVSKIVSEANSQNCVIYCVTLGMTAPQSVKYIATQTGGEVYENVTTVEEAESVYLTILRKALGIPSPCTIEWNSDISCNSDRKNVELSLNSINLKSLSSYILPSSLLAKLSFSPLTVVFRNPIPGVLNEQKVNVTASNADFTITNITSINPLFTISPKNFNLKKGESIELTVSYTAQDSGYAYSKFELENNLCPVFLYASGGWKGRKPKKTTLKVTQPNGGEKFVVGSDTLIKWEGVLPSDTVRLEYSINNGQSWNIISEKSSGLEHKWLNIPKPVSNQCLVRASQSNNPASSIIWEKTYGGSGWDQANSIIETRDGKLVVAGFAVSSDGDIKSGNKGAGDYWIIKIDPNDGEIIWEKTFGGTSDDYANSIIETSDGNLVVAGHTKSNDGDIKSGNKGDSDYWIIKISGDGKILQSDISDNVFSIVVPEFTSKDIDMEQVLKAATKDTTITDFIQNIGSWNFRVDSIYFEGADKDAFSLVSGFPKYELSPNNSHFAEFVFTPTEARQYQANIVIITQSDTLKQIIRGEGIEQRLEIINKYIDFGKVELGSQKDTIQALTIKNIGITPINITNTKHDLPNDIDFTTLAGGGPFTLQPNETRKMDLRFEPSNAGRTSGTLEFHYNGIGSPAVVQLFGEGINAKPRLQTISSSFSNLICESTSTNNILLKNIGRENLIISSISLSGNDASEFSINETFPITILPNDEYKLEVNFNPSSIGTKTAELEIKSNSEVDSVLILPLSARKDLIEFAVQNSIDLGVLCPNESKLFRVLVSNQSTIESYINIKGDSEIDIKGDSINFAINMKDSVELEFTGISQEDVFSRKINIEDSCGNIYTVNISGIIETPKVEINNTSFVTTIGSHKQQNIEIKNNSSTKIIVNSINGIQAPFLIVGSPFPLEIQANSSAFVTIEFSPTSTIDITQQLQAEIEPCSIIKPFEIKGSSSQARLIVKSIETAAYAGEEISVPIISDLAENLIDAGITSIDFDLSYNPTLLATADYSADIVSDSMAYIHLTNIPINEIAGSTLLNIKFIAGLGNAEFCDLRFSNVKMNSGIADLTTIDGKFNLLGICNEGGTRLINPLDNNFIFTISPNPSDGNVAISINLIENGAKSLKMYDYNGVLIESIDLSNELGEISLNLNTEKYTNGLYFVHFQTPTIIKREKLIINR